MEATNTSRHAHYRRDLAIEIIGSAAVCALVACGVAISVLTTLHVAHCPWATPLIVGIAALAAACCLAGDRHFTRLLRRK